jgi:uncharacterized protein
MKGSTTSTPRLLRSAQGWWFLGGRRLLLLGEESVDAAGALRPEVQQQLAACGAHGPTPLLAYSLTVLTATACNLGCGYCFQNVAADPHGGTRPPRIANWTLTPETARRTLAFAAGQMAQAGLDSLDLHLFGGEPLMNPDGCLTLLRLAGDCGLRTAHMTSNGTLLTPALARQLNQLGLGSIQITFDGSRDDHDRIRVRRGGGATFDTILGNLARATETTDLRWDLRVNVSHHNRAELGRLAEQVAAQVDPTRCVISFTTVDDVGVGYANALTRDRELVDSFVRWMTDAIDRGFRIHRPTPSRPCQSCMFRDGQFGAVVNADGKLYSCWESAGKPGWEVGNVGEGYRPGVDARWVSCGYSARAIDPDAATSAFTDAVDAGVLDYLYATGRLGLINGRPAAAGVGQPDERPVPAR